MKTFEQHYLAEAEAPVSADKAAKILKDGKVHGKPLSTKQKGMFGAIAGGTFKPSKLKERRRSFEDYLDERMAQIGGDDSDAVTKEIGKAVGRSGMPSSMKNDRLLVNYAGEDYEVIVRKARLVPGQMTRTN